MQLQLFFSLLNFRQKEMRNIGRLKVVKLGRMTST
jgi:hypothetical protein